MKKILAIVMAAAMLLSLCACGAVSEQTAAPGEKTYTVGICQLVQHVALDAATQGFKDALTEALGDAVVFDEQNASNDTYNHRNSSDLPNIHSYNVVQLLPVRK